MESTYEKANTNDSDNTKTKHLLCVKVYLLLFLQCLKIVGYCALCTYNEPYRTFWKHKELYMLWAILPFVIEFVVIQLKADKFEASANLILLFVVSTTITFGLGGICFAIHGEVVLSGFAIASVMYLSSAVTFYIWMNYKVSLFVAVAINVACSVAVAVILHDIRWVQVICMAVGVQIFYLYVIGLMYMIVDNDYRNELLYSTPSCVATVMIVYTEWLTWICAICLESGCGCDCDDD